jgi:molecular chaperone HtpG
MVEERLDFQAEVSKLLHIVANSLYSEKEIFLRELISNASDACDRLRYLALTKPELTADDSDFRIGIELDKKAKTLKITDNGVGMSRDELIENLGTIARSGTTEFVQDLQEDEAKADGVSLIGQFGVGFYSGFMVAKEVSVESRKAGESEAWIWTSDGLGGFTVTEGAREGRGTTVSLILKKGEEEFLDETRVRHIVKTYSDHIALPITLAGDAADADTPLNTASALWTRPKKDITEQQYKEFYHHVGHAFDDPWLTLHAKAEGKIEYTLLLFVPSTRPLDLFDPQRKGRLKLYVKRVFITDDCDELIPSYLRFLRGIVDCEDLSLNISREMLQNNPVVLKIRKALIKRVLSELTKKAEKAPDEYLVFWDGFGAALKEGIYEDTDHKESLLELARFRSTHASDAWVSLQDYVGRMKDGQDEIYYISGDDVDGLRRSPQIEGFAAKGLEVLLMTDPIDDFWINAIGEYKEKRLVSATRGSIDLNKFQALESAEADKPEAASEEGVSALIALLKLNLDERVKDVRTSERLTESPVCLVADEGDVDIHLARLLKQHQQLDQTATRILEINPRHELIKVLAKAVSNEGAADALADAAELLLEQALILEGEPLPDPAGFSRRLTAVMARGLAA